MSPPEVELLTVLPGMTLEQSRAVRDLRAAGFAVCIFTPHELGETSADAVEETMCMRGWDIIQN